MGAYARLARLPPPVRRLADFEPLLRRAASLHGACVLVEAGPAAKLEIDADQIEQVFINLIKNAVEATAARNGSQESDARVRLRWRVEDGELTAEVEDEGTGLANTDNLWVPFFTTKPGGSGIGLVLSREIVENHGGSIALANRAVGCGCVARVSLPLGRARSA
jgi:nitrogen fixation/metabolism regulation signal transduction histidine kinase